jgi:hypothetical protein
MPDRNPTPSKGILSDPFMSLQDERIHPFGRRIGEAYLLIKL